jgi:hypothetical protein
MIILLMGNGWRGHILMKIKKLQFDASSFDGFPMLLYSFGALGASGDS